MLDRPRHATPRHATLALAVLAALTACAGDDPPGLPAPTVLTPDPGSYEDLEYSPDGTRIAFAKLEFGVAQIWVANADGSGARPVTPASPDAFNPEWSLDGRSLVYQSNQLGLMDLFVVPVDGGEPRQLTSGPRVESYPKFASDGTRITYLDLRSGNADIWSVSPGGGEPTQLTSTSAAESGIGASPDGRYLAFTRREGGRSTAWLLSFEDGSERPLTSEGFETFTGVSWSPDSREVVVQSTRTGLSDLWAYPVDGGEPRQITRDVRADRTALYSPDGRWIAFLSDRGGQTDVWIVPARGGDAIRVTDDAVEELELRWRPDGRGLAFSRADGVSTLHAVDASGGSLRTIVADRNNALLGDVSPDGRQIAYMSEVLGAQNILIVPIGGGEPRVLVASPGNDDRPRFSPDGARVAFLSDRGGAFHLYVVPTEGGDEVRLTGMGSTAHEWSPSGDRIAFAAADETSLWIVEASGGGEPTQVGDFERVRGVQWSPDGSTLLVSGTAPDGAGGIYSVPAAGGTPTLLTPPEAVDAFATSWSPDGSMFAYDVFVTGFAYEVFVANADGTGHRRLTDQAGYDIAPVWSPDGSLIYFQTERVSLEEGGAGDLAVVPVEGGEVRILHRSPERGSSSPIVTPDGSELVFTEFPLGNHYVTVDVGALLDAATAGDGR